MSESIPQKPYISQDEVIAQVIAACESAGGKSAFAKKAGVSPATITLTISGKNKPGDGILKLLKLRHQSCYFSTAREKKPKKPVE